MSPDSPNITQVVPMLLVSDMERSLRYYVDGLGFTRTNQWIVDGKIRWCWLELGRAALMLQEFHPYADRTWASFGKVGEGVSLNFICNDAIAIYRDISARGIEATEPQVGNSMWETAVSDPDGYRIHFESPTGAPEEMKLSEVNS